MELQMSLENSTKKLYEDNDQDESEQELGEEENKNSTDVHFYNTERDDKNPRDHNRRVAHCNQTNSKANPQRATESEPKTLKHVMMKREKW